MIYADIDFETYSEAGFIWDESIQKYKAPPNAMKKGLPTIGAARYAEHPSTEVLSCAYDLKDGKGKRLWKPGDPQPLDLIKHVLDGKLLEAWNVSFERWIWEKVCIRKYGWVEVHPEQWRCAASKAVAHALPKSLDPCGTVLDITHKKDKDGIRLLTKFSIPRNPTKSDPRRRIKPEDDPEDAERLYRYNIRDIQAEAELSGLIPDLNSFELKFWQCDQEINHRGVAIDLPMIKAAISILEQAYATYNARIRTITNGAVSRASELAKIRKWMESYDVCVPLLDADMVTLLLTGYLPDPVREVLEIRERIGSAAVKKLYAMSNRISKSGRIHDLFIYHSARTGRAAGAGVQPQNLPNSGPGVTKCSTCGSYYPLWLRSCPNGCTISIPKIEEWNRGAVEQALVPISTGNLDCVEYYWGDAIGTISGCLRSLFISGPGKDLICSDYSAIEAVVLAEIAGESWRQEVFRTHGKIYETSVAKIKSVDLQYYIDHRNTTGQHHPDRKIGKVAELACFTHDTLVLTNRGYVAIMDVRKNDLLWDGIEWVKHEGVVHKGKREVIKLDGVKMTPEHPISINGFWMEANELASSKSILTQALATGSENLPISEKMKNDQLREIGWHDVNAHAVNLLHRLFVILGLDGLSDAICVLNEHQKQHELNGLRHTKSTDILYQILNIDEDLEIVCHRLSVVATILKINLTLTMGEEELQFMSPGEIIRPNFLNILLRFPDGITSFLRWIEQIVAKVMLRGILDLSHVLIINSINEKSQNCKKELKNLKNVYDIVNAGNRHRFTIKTNSGHLLVHNSGYQGWIGAWRAFGADAYMTEEEIKQAILAWRAASPAIVEFWGGQTRRYLPEYYGTEGAAIQAVLYPGHEYDCRGFKWVMRDDVLYCLLPSGRNLTYHRPRLIASDRRPGTLALSYEGWNSNATYGAPGWMRIDTWGGRLVENITQAVARDILAYAIVNLEKSGYPVVLHVHDEIVSEIPENQGSINEFEEIMSTMPEWAKDWPIKATGGWRNKRYGK